MAKTVRDTRLGSRADRAKLPVSGKPHWRDLGSGLHLGYRKGKHVGAWVFRRHTGDRKKPYVVERIADADDISDADGAKVLNFRQAQDRAHERLAEIGEQAKFASLGPPLTVSRAIEDYCAMREARDERRRGQFGLKRDARSRLTKNVLADEQLAAKSLASVTTDDLAKWRDTLFSKMTTGAAKRTSNDLKACLNLAAERARAQLPPDMRDTIRAGLKSVSAESPAAREMQILPNADVRRIVAAAWEIDKEGGWSGDLARLVLVLAATGTRFSQAVRMTVADVQVEQKRLMIPTSRKGRGEKKITRTGFAVGDDVLDALRPAANGRVGSASLFLRPRFEAIAVANYVRAERGPWRASAEMAGPWREIVKRAGLAGNLTPYCLRHSSIVRGLRAGLPTRLIAQLHDTSSAMIEKYYAAQVTDALDELARRMITPLISATVTPIAAATA